MPTLPILYSFRRCPYAIRARLALLAAGIAVELREIALKDKPAAFLQASPSATVPTLVSRDGVIDESLDIMRWALSQNDPGGWLVDPSVDGEWIARNDGPFKRALDRTKYPNRFPDSDPDEARAQASSFLSELDQSIDHWIGGRESLADYALMPFVRQFAGIDPDWFAVQPWPNVQAWLNRLLASALFQRAMVKTPLWRDGDTPILFATPNAATSPSTA